MVVKVDNESGEIVALAMNQTAGIVSFGSYKAESLTEIAGYGETAYPEIVVYLFFTECENTDCYTAYLIMACCNVLLVGCIDFDYFTFFGIAFYACDGSRKYPRVKTEK